MNSREDPFQGEDGRRPEVGCPPADGDGARTEGQAELSNARISASFPLSKGEMLMPSIAQSQVPGVEPTYRGKVRDIYDLGEDLLLVATDRVSAYDVVLPSRSRRRARS